MKLSTLTINNFFIVFFTFILPLISNFIFFCCFNKFVQLVFISTFSIIFSCFGIDGIDTSTLTCSIPLKLIELRFCFVKIGFLIIGIILIFGILFTLINSFQLITFFSGFSTIILFIPFINILFSLACLSIILGFLLIFISCIFIFSNPGMNNFPSFISFNEGFFIKGFVIPLMNNLVAFITFTIKVLLDLISILTTFLDILFTVLTFFGIFKSLVFITLLN